MLDTLPAELQGFLPAAASKVCHDILTVAYEALPTSILNHSIRVYLLARWLHEHEQRSLTGLDDRLLFTAALGHDLGASDLYNGKQRFEVEGADAACEVCARNGVAKADEQKVWTAIALHTSPGIAERIDPFTRLIRLGVKLDFSRATREQYGAVEYAALIEKQLPRLNVEKILADAVVQQAEKFPEKVDSQTWPDSEKHPKASWPGILLRAHMENPDESGVNFAF